jgi:hypothetical protein
MRLFVCLLFALLLAACGSTTPTPTSTLPAPTTGPAAEATDELSVLSMTIEVPISGTLTYGQSGVSTFEFDKATFARTGGITGQTLTVEVNADGTLIRDGESSSVSETVVADINTRLNTLNFYGIRGVFTGPASPDAYSYFLTVDSPMGSRTLNTQDGMTPPELLDLFSFFAELGTSTESGS